MNYAIVDKTSLEILNVYWSESGPDPSRINDTQVQLVVPENLDYFCIKAVDLNTIIEDPTKSKTKIDTQWVLVRDQQKQKLQQSDWTCSVIDPPPEILSQRDQWIAYRQNLRDVTIQTDPFNIIWPTPPS